MRIYLGSSGLLGPLILFFSPPQKRKMFLRPRQKNVKLKSEPWVLGKEYREVRHILEEQRSAYPADRKYGCPRAPSVRVRLGRAGRGPADGKGLVHRGQREGCLASQSLTWNLLLGPQAQAGIFHCLTWTCCQGPARSGAGVLAGPHLATLTPFLPHLEAYHI